MSRYILRRLILAIPVLLGISVIVFLIMAMIPGDPATAILGHYATPDNVAKLNRDLGLDRPLVSRYFIWIGNLLQGDLGRSFSLNRPVLDEVLERFNATLVLAGVSFVLCSVLGIMAGAWSAARQYGLADKAITFAVLLGISVPSFFLGMVMILIFAVRLKWFPVSGMWPIYGARGLPELISHLTLPTISLAVVATGVIERLSRSAKQTAWSNASTAVSRRFSKATTSAQANIWKPRCIAMCCSTTSSSRNQLWAARRPCRR